MKPVKKKEEPQISIVTGLTVMLGIFVGGGVVLWLMFESIALLGSGSSMQEQTIFTGELGQLTEERIYPGRPATLKARVRFPAGAMHSINLPSNKVFWEIAVEVERATGKSFEHAFEIPVLPGAPA